MATQFVRFESSALNIDLSLFAVDNQVLLTSSQLKIGSESAVFALAKERALSSGEPLYVCEIEDSDLIVDGEVNPAWLGLLYDMDFDEEKLLILARDKGFEQHYSESECDVADIPIDVEPEELVYELEVNDFYVAYLLWTQEDVIGFLLEEGFTLSQDSVNLVSLSLIELLQPSVLFTDLLRSAIWRVAHALDPLPQPIEPPFQLLPWDDAA